MIFGFNTDVVGKDGNYHVQTEDRGPKHPVIDSIIYMGGGKIVDRRRTDYDPAQVTQKQIEEMVRKQHKELVDSIRSGSYVRPAGNEEKTNPSPSPAGYAPGYVIELLNADDLTLDGQLCFDLAVREKGPGKGQAKGHGKGGHAVPQGVTVDARWIIAGETAQERSVPLGDDGRAGIMVPVPEAEAEAFLVVRACGPAGEEFAKFRAKSA